MTTKMTASRPLAASPALVAGGRRLALYAGRGLLGVYVAGVAAGYAWLHYMRGNDQIGVADVALLRVGAVQRGLAAQHFVQAQSEWDKKNYPAAYLLFTSAVRQDPANIDGRLVAVRFLRSLGGNDLAFGLLEEGLARAPDDRRLVEPVFELLLSTGRERRALDLLRQRYGENLSGPNGPLLQRYEIEATLATDGAPAARRLLERHPGLFQEPAAVPVVARVLWASQERLRAIEMLAGHVRTAAAARSDFELLAHWQEAGGLAGDAVATARRACERFPQEIAARVLLVETIVDEVPGSPAGTAAVAAYVRDLAGRPEALIELAALAGRKGWDGLARSLYEVAANSPADLTALAFSYGDALAQNGRYNEDRQLLEQLESQVSDDHPAVMVQLRQRQVIAAAALGDTDNVREYARRLAAVLHRDPTGLEACRKVFQRLAIPEAVAELTSRSLATDSGAVAKVK